MALPAGVFDLLYGEEDELQDSGDDMDKDECGSPLRWGQKRLEKGTWGILKIILYSSQDLDV